MPKLYEYFGLVIFFYANEHEPVHVHGNCQGREGRAELIIVDGVITEIRFGGAAGRAPLAAKEAVLFKEIVTARADDIVRKWIDFFVLNKPVPSERITRRLK
jgi:hypothetical protein